VTSNRINSSKSENADIQHGHIIPLPFLKKAKWAIFVKIRI